MASRSRTHQVVLTLALAWFLVGTPAPNGAPADLAALFDKLNALSTANYSGGLPRRNRALAAQIRSALTQQFPQIPCEQVGDGEGTLVGFADDAGDERKVPEDLDPNLARLLKAFEHDRQEVRDTAAYTIGLIGPAAKSLESALRKRFAVMDSSLRVKGNWHNDAYAKVTCQSVVAADFRQVIPDAMLPPLEPWENFLGQAATLMATLYLDENIEYPPGMMSHAYSSYGMAHKADPAVPLLARILENDRLSVQKQFEAATALGALEADVAKPALPALLRHTSTKDPQLRFAVTEALVRSKHSAAIPLLIERVELRWDHYAWERALCQYGTLALPAEDALLNLVRVQDGWPTDVRSAALVLGCIGSKKSIPGLLSLLPFPDWQTQEVVAAVLGRLGDSKPEVVAALEKLAKAHWSKRVRTTAERALEKLAGRFVDNGSLESFEVFELRWSPQPIDHGLPWCDDRGRFSIDGRGWFNVTWTKLNGKVPKGFKRKAAEIGTRHFLRVDDGWLYAANYGHEGGEFEHVSDDGRVTELSAAWHTSGGGFVREGDAILGFGSQILISGEGGVLFDVARRSDGVWKATRIAALPSGATSAFAAGPNGEVLLSDEANKYAVIARQVVPLKCTRVHKGNFFDERNRPG